MYQYMNASYGMALRQTLWERTKRKLVDLATTITYTGREMITGALAKIANGGSTLNPTRGSVGPAWIGWGTGSGTAIVNSTALNTETYTTSNTVPGTPSTGYNTRPAATVSQVASGSSSTLKDQIQFVATLTAAQNQTGSSGTAAGTISNMGIFDSNGQSVTLGTAGAPAGGNLFMWGDFTPVSLNSGDSIQLTATMQFS